MPKKLARRIPPKSPVAAPVPAGGGRQLSLSLRNGRVGTRALTEFTNQLSVLLDAGIPITRSLRILEGQMAGGPMKRICGALVEDVEAGTPLSEAMAKHEATFDALYTNMMRAGEAGGVQEEILGRLSGFLEKSEVIRSRVRGALLYPIAILVVALGVLLLVFAFVIPRFKQVFESVGQGGIEGFHWSTRVVIEMGEHLQGFWWTYLVGALLLWALHQVLMSKVAGYRALMHRLALRMPLFGKLVHKSLVGRFARTFGTLIQSGVPHLEALDILRSSVANVHMKEAVASVHASIREGAGIAVPMGESGMFDDIVVNMVDVGEQTGELDRMLVKIADRYETEIDRTVESTFKVLEPVLLVVMAVFVGFIVFALFTPLLKMLQTLNK